MVAMATETSGPLQKRLSNAATATPRAVDGEIRDSRGGATLRLGGAVAPAKKKKKFPSGYEEKINGPPQHWTAGPPTHFSTILPVQPQL